MARGGWRGRVGPNGNAGCRLVISRHVEELGCPLKAVGGRKRLSHGVETHGDSLVGLKTVHVESCTLQQDTETNIAGREVTCRKKSVLVYLVVSSTALGPDVPEVMAKMSGLSAVMTFSSPAAMRWMSSL